MPDGEDPPCDAFGPARRCLEIIAAALEEAGSSLEDVVRTRVHLVRTGDSDAVGRAHGEVSSDIRPANTTVTIAELVDPRWRVEIEVDAVISE